jgi:hypothetical protein
MESLKHLKLENIILSYERSVSGTIDPLGLGGFIKANGSTLELIELHGAGWVAESGEFETTSHDHWASFFAFLGDNRPAGLWFLSTNGHYISKDVVAGAYRV